MQINLVRHGQSEWQLTPGADLDAPLSPLGEEQAKRLGHWLAQHKIVGADTRLEITSLAASPLRRAQQTAVHLADALDLPVRTVPDLREADFHVAAHLPSRDGPREPVKPYEPSELYRSFKNQVLCALDVLIEQAESGGGTVLAVTHGGFIKTMLRVIMRGDDFCFRLYNTGITQLRWWRGRWHLVHLNLMDHLEAELRTI